MLGITSRITYLLFAILYGSSVALGGELTPQLVFEKYKNMFDSLKEFHNHDDNFDQGEWLKHYGDGAAHGPLFDLIEYDRLGDEFHLERAMEALEWNFDFLNNVMHVPLYSPVRHIQKLETASMALLSLVKSGAFLQGESRDRFRKQADRLLWYLDSAAWWLGYYFDAPVGEFAISTYGATSVTSFVGVIHLEYVLLFPEVNRDYHLRLAERYLNGINLKSWDADLSAYRLKPGDPKLYLYPNASMMLFYGTFYKVTGKAEYLDRYLALYKGIKRLKAPSGDHYYSPYSAEEMGSKTDDYSTLSSQNYLMIALIYGYEITGDINFIKEVSHIMGFLEEKLFNGRLLTHHWLNGGPAKENELYYYCLGCNMQTLYILVYLEGLV